MTLRTAQDIAAYLNEVHGATFHPDRIAGPAKVASGLGVLVRRAGANLPLEREPLDFHRLYGELAEADES